MLRRVRPKNRRYGKAVIHGPRGHVKAQGAGYEVEPPVEPPMPPTEATVSEFGRSYAGSLAEDGGTVLEYGEAVS